MKKVKITILKTTFQRELAEEYGVEGLSTCPLMEEGQVFYADYAKPEGFCDEAWKAIYQYVFALAHGVDEIHMTARDTTVKIVCDMGGVVTGDPKPFYDGNVTPVVLKRENYLY